MTSTDDPTEVKIVAAFQDRGWTLATAESVTGGLLAQRITSVPGASAVFTVGWVTYATEQKTARLGVPADLLAKHGVVSSEVAAAMAEGALEHSGADFALATTGVAGPDPLVQAGHEPVPVGQVFIALGHTRRSPGGATTHVHVVGPRFEGTRAEIQQQASEAALALVFDPRTAP